MLVENRTKSIIATHLKVGPRGTRTLVTFKPGMNDVDPGAWQSFCALKTTQHLLEVGDLIDHAKISPAAAAPKVSLTGMSPGAAIKIVKQTFDVPTLERWVTEDDRSSVLKALEKQLDGIRDGKKEEVGDEDADGEGDDEP